MTKAFSIPIFFITLLALQMAMLAPNAAFAKKVKNTSLEVRYGNVKKGKLKNDVKARELWYIATKAAHENKVQIGVLATLDLIEMNPPHPSQDELKVHLARLNYQDRKFTIARDMYQSVSRSSDFYLLAQEELAWTYLQLKEEQKAVAVLTSLTNPLFKDVIGPEPFYTLSFNYWWTCQYPKVLQTNSLFKERFMDRVRKLQLAHSSKADLDITTTINLLPLSARKDHQLIMAHASRDKLQTQKRMRTLIKRELDTFEVLTQKLHLLEAEVIQAVHTDSPFLHTTEAKQKSQRNSKNRQEILTFPARDEVWIDEIFSLNASVDRCSQETTL